MTAIALYFIAAALVILAPGSTEPVPFYMLAGIMALYGAAWTIRDGKK